ncbi:MAG: hypothetical protein ABSA13_07755 [Beijerinckiaceae bacterium]|jgi:hypothetical protein
MTVEIIPVSGIGKFLTFCRIPRQIYKGMKGFAPPLDAERWTAFAPALNPHFKLVDSQAFLAKKDGKWVGRVLAQIYKEMKPVDTSPAQFGCLDAIDDVEVVKALLDAAEEWLKAKGADLIVGPFSPSVNAESGLLVEGFDALPMVFMPWNPPYLPGLVEACGYHKARDLISYRYQVRESDREAKGSIMSRPEWAQRLKIRTLDLKNLKSESPIIVDIFNDGWNGNWGFVPFTIEEFLSLADGLKYVMPVDGGFMVELDGEPQAFGIVLPNLHEILADFDGRLFPFGLPKVISRVRNHHFKSGRLVLFGLRRALHRKAVGGVVILAFIEEMRRRSRSLTIEHVEFGWVLENNVGMRRPIEFSGAEVDKVHRVYEKQLSA